LESKQKIVLITVITIVLIITVVLIAIFWPSEYDQTYNRQYEDCIHRNKNKYTLLIARKTGDTSYCEEAPKESKNLCIAYATKNADAYCADIEPEYEQARQRCIAEAVGDASKCPESDFWCMAKASGDESYCQELDDTEDVIECRRSVPKNAEYWISAEAEEQCKEIATSAAENRLRLEAS